MDSFKHLSTIQEESEVSTCKENKSGNPVPIHTIPLQPILE